MAIRKIPNDTNVFHFYNANPKNKRTSDCVIRALSLFLDKSWDDVLTDLYKIALKEKTVPTDDICYKKYLKSLGYEMLKQPRKFDNTKYTGKEFCEQVVKSNYKYLAHIGGHHIVCISKNKINDIWDSSDGCIGNYWMISTLKNN